MYVIIVIIVILGCIIVMREFHYRIALGTPTLKTKALCLVSNVQHV